VFLKHLIDEAEASEHGDEPWLSKAAMIKGTKRKIKVNGKVVLLG